MANEKRLIDANALISEHCNGCAADIQAMCKTDPVCGSMMWIVEAPTVDAVEVPPIKVGDTAYFIINRKVYKAEVYLIRWEHHKRYGIHSEIYANVGQYSSVGASFDDFGKILFLTEEEAKEALAKMDGGNDK